MGKTKVLAFYLPQFHPTPENDKWWGEGFTEWTNVAKSKPLFCGHKQPKIPSSLGFYDLRLPEVRNKQAKLAKEAGVDAFCYWNYWMGDGVRLLTKPLELVLESGEPEFPFCLAWANHSWQKKTWSRDVSRFDQTVLQEQKYGGESDYLAHFNALLPAFKDHRYYKIDGKLVFVIFAPLHVPDCKSFMNLWNELAQKNGLPGFYFIGRILDKRELKKMDELGLDAMVYENKTQVLGTNNVNLARLINLISTVIRYPLTKKSYKAFINQLDYSLAERNDIYPSIYPNWDRSPRLGYCAELLTNATPELFYKHIKKVLKVIKGKPDKDKVLFLKSWNEWAEGNYIEPDLEYGKQRITMLRKALDEDV